MFPPLIVATSFAFHEININISIYKQMHYFFFFKSVPCVWFQLFTSVEVLHLFTIKYQYNILLFGVIPYFFKKILSIKKKKYTYLKDIRLREAVPGLLPLIRC